MRRVGVGRNRIDVPTCNSHTSVPLFCCVGMICFLTLHTLYASSKHTHTDCIIRSSLTVIRYVLRCAQNNLAVASSVSQGLRENLSVCTEKNTRLHTLTTRRRSWNILEQREKTSSKSDHIMYTTVSYGGRKDPPHPWLSNHHTSSHPSSCFLFQELVPLSSRLFSICSCCTAVQHLALELLPHKQHHKFSRVESIEKKKNFPFVHHRTMCESFLWLTVREARTSHHHIFSSNLTSYLPVSN